VAKKFETLHTKWVALTFTTARLVDARDAGDTTAAAKLDAARLERDATMAELRRQDPGFDRWEC
jgi:hypothetical protein